MDVELEVSRSVTSTTHFSTLYEQTLKDVLPGSAAKAEAGPSTVRTDTAGPTLFPIAATSAVHAIAGAYKLGKT
jgi:hypothetical protein